MAMIEHRSESTVMGYFQAGSLESIRACRLLGDEPHSQPLARTACLVASVNKV